MGTEKGPEFYTGKGYLKKGALEHNMKIYEEAKKLLPSHKDYRTIVDLGCGVGYFSLLVRKHKYYGIDFSKDVIREAKRISPDKTFICNDLLSDDINSLFTDDAIYVCIEALEHIVRDMDVIRRIPSGSPVIFSVPNRDYESHVRYFKNQNVIINRYESLIDFDNCEWRIIETNPAKDAKIFMFHSRRL